METISLSQLMEKFLINKNQAKVDTFISARQWQPSKSLFHYHFVDALMLKILYIYSVSYFYFEWYIAVEIYQELKSVTNTAKL